MFIAEEPGRDPSLTSAGCFLLGGSSKFYPSKTGKSLSSRTARFRPAKARKVKGLCRENKPTKPQQGKRSDSVAWGRVPAREGRLLPLTNTSSLAPFCPGSCLPF